MTSSKDNRLYYFLAFLTLAAYGSYGVFVRWSGLEGEEQYLVLYRTAIGLVPVVIAIILTGRLGELVLRKRRLLLAASGLVIALQSFAGSRAINLLPVSDALFIIYLAPVLVAAFAPLVLREKMERNTVVALAVALAGLAVISFAGRGGSVKPLDLTGVGYALLAAFSYAALILVLKLLREDIPPLTIYFYQAVVALLVRLPFTGFRPPELTGGNWAYGVVRGLVFTAFLGMTYITLLKRVKAQHMGVLAYVDPVSATFFAWALLGETPGWQNFVGGAMIIAAGIVVMLTADPGAAPEEPHA